MNDLPKLMHCKIVLFADDIKLWTRIESTNDCLLLQRDLDALYDWSLRNKLPLNVAKCKMLQLGKRWEFCYRLGPDELDWVAQEKDLGIWIAAGLKPGLQCEAVFRKSSVLLGMLRRLFGRFTKDTIPVILNTYIRPAMEYAVQAWAPWMQKDIRLLQRIYHRATKLVDGLSHLPYNERLNRLNLFDFSYRRLRGDIILLYKILKLDNHPLQILFIRREPHSTTKHDYSLIVPHSRVNCRRYFFAVRVCFVWNSLPQYVVHSPNVNQFKANLDAFMCAHAIVEPLHSI
jgi:ribonuclease P/MRP protein subunit RPP40